MQETPPSRPEFAPSWIEAHPLFAPRPAAGVLLGLLCVYVAAFCLLRPPTVTVADENNYVRQAQLILSGKATVAIEDPFTGEALEVRPINDYPLGTALLLVPFVAVAGRDGAPFLSLLCVVVAVAVTGRWLHEAGRSPLWAALLLVYPATLVMGRIAMSEAPSLAVASVGLWLYWRGLRSGAPAFLAAGLLAGASFALREANVLLFAPFFLGSLLRRDRGFWALVLGGALGLTLRFASAALFFGDPFFTKSPAYGFSLSSLAATLPLYAFSLLVLIPGGLVAALAYRGPRRPELVATVVVFVALHLVYSYSALESGFSKRLVLGPRYFIPLLPVLAFAAAEAWPRLAGRLPLAARARIAPLRVHASWAADQAAIREAIEAHTPEKAVIVANARAIGKFIDLVGSDRLVLDRDRIGPRERRALLERRGEFHLVLLDRSDSAFWRRDALDNARYASALPHTLELISDLQVTPSDRLRIWRVSD